MCDRNISEPVRKSGSGARRLTNSKTPRFSGLVASEVPTSPCLTEIVVLESPRRVRRSLSAIMNSKGRRVSRESSRDTARREVKLTGGSRVGEDQWVVLLR